MPFFPKLEGLGAILAPSWRVLGPSWLQVRGSWDHVASKLGGLGSKLSLLGSKLGVKLALKLHFANIAKNTEKSRAQLELVGLARYVGGGDSRGTCGGEGRGRVLAAPYRSYTVHVLGVLFSSRRVIELSAMLSYHLLQCCVTCPIKPCST